MHLPLYEPPKVTPPSFTLEDVLSNNTTIAFRNFEFFLRQTYCTENLKFWLAIQRYKHCILGYFDQPKDPRYLQSDDWVPKPVDIPITIRLKNGMPFHITDSELPYLASSELVYFELLRQKMSQIITTYICVDAPQEINLPCDMREEILYHFRSGNFHPNILTPACEQAMELMRVNSFIPWVSEMVSRQQAMQKKKLQREAREANRLSISSFRLRRLRSFSSLDTASTMSKEEEDPKQRHKRMFQIIQRISRTLGIGSKSSQPICSEPSLESTLMIATSTLAVMTPPATPVSTTPDRRSWIWKS